MIIIAVSMIEEQPSSHTTHHMTQKIWNTSFLDLFSTCRQFYTHKHANSQENARMSPGVPEGAIPKDVHVDLKFCSHSNATP